MVTIYYSIILEVDCGKDYDIDELIPAPVANNLTKIEDENVSKFALAAYRHDSEEFFNDVWGESKHRKYIGIIEDEVFNEIVKTMKLKALDEETAGANHMIGFNGIVPAISFLSEKSNYKKGLIQGAYVTPTPKAKKDLDDINESELILTGEKVDSIFKEVINKYK